jgi:hypothetical protein
MAYSALHLHGGGSLARIIHERQWQGSSTSSPRSGLSKIAQRFIAEERAVVSESSPGNGRLKIAECRISPSFQSSASRTAVVIVTPHPSNELLGYSHSVRFADWVCVDCRELQT